MLKSYPKSILGIMVLAAGLELAKVGNSLNKGAPDLWDNAVGESFSGSITRVHRSLSDDECAERWTVMLMTTAGILAFKNFNEEWFILEVSFLNNDTCRKRAGSFGSLNGGDGVNAQPKKGFNSRLSHLAASANEGDLSSLDCWSHCILRGD